MGAHTIANLALRDPSRWRRHRPDRPGQRRGAARRRSRWRTGTCSPPGSRTDGIDGFIAAYEVGMDPDWHDTLVRIARERLEPASRPRRGRRGAPRGAALGAVRRAWRSSRRSTCRRWWWRATTRPTRATPRGRRGLDRGAAARRRLIGEGEGESPLAWQGGRLSREIAGVRRRARLRRRSRPAKPPPPRRILAGDEQRLRQPGPLHRRRARARPSTTARASRSARSGGSRTTTPSTSSTASRSPTTTATLRFVDAPEVARTFERGGDALDHRGRAARARPPSRPRDRRDRHRWRQPPAAACSAACSAAEQPGRVSRPARGFPGIQFRT